MKKLARFHSISHFPPYPQAIGGKVSACESQEVNSGYPFLRPFQRDHGNIGPVAVGSAGEFPRTVDLLGHPE